MFLTESIKRRKYVLKFVLFKLTCTISWFLMYFVTSSLSLFPFMKTVDQLCRCSVEICFPWPFSLPVRCSEEKDNNFYSSDSDFDDEEPKKFHIKIRPVVSNNRSNSVATEKELKATVGALTLPPNRGPRQQVVPHSFCFKCLYKQQIKIYLKKAKSKIVQTEKNMLRKKELSCQCRIITFCSSFRCFSDSSEVASLQ